jgi:hypothetical protein
MVVSAPDLKAFLLATPFFGGLPDPSLDLLSSMLVECRFDAGATVVVEGEPGRSMFIVKAGRLAVSKRASSGSVIPISVLEPGDFFGEMTLIEMQNRSATVAAESPRPRWVSLPLYPSYELIGFFGQTRNVYPRFFEAHGCCRHDLGIKPIGVPQHNGFSGELRHVSLD